MQTSTHSLGSEIVAFTELLSLGFATIGVAETLRSVGGQILENIAHTRIHHPRRESKAFV